MLISPFKMARVSAAIAAGGRMPQGRWIEDDSNPLTDGPLEVLPEAQAAFLAKAMRRVVTEGTARRAMDGAEISFAGKTGTAQLDESESIGRCAQIFPSIAINAAVRFWRRWYSSIAWCSGRLVFPQRRGTAQMEPERKSPQSGEVAKDPGALSFQLRQGIRLKVASGF